MTPDEIVAAVEAALPGAIVRLKDLTGGQDHWSAVVISDAFEDVPSIKRHRLVYEALGGAVGGAIHALALETWTRSQAQERGLLDT
jgi:stress-induced morphogen